jgi:uncharacterized phage-associated protein
MAEIKFRFNLDKLVHSLAFFADRRVRNLTKLKAAKLLYFADKQHLLRYGRPILGDIYFCLPYGPIPSISLNEMSDAIARPEVLDDDVSAFHSVLAVRKHLFTRHPVFELRSAFDPDVFSDSEIEILQDVVQRYGKMNAGQLVDLTHNDPTYAIPNKLRSPAGRAPIPYELFFVGAPEEAQQLLAVLKAEQQEGREMDEIMACARAGAGEHDQVLA